MIFGIQILIFGFQKKIQNSNISFYMIYVFEFK
jgi:hypothetical protein